MLQLIDIGRSQVSQLAALQMRPEIFVRIEFGAVGRKPKYMQPPVPRQELLDSFGAVKLHAIPQNEQRTPGMAQQLTKELDHSTRANSASMQAEVAAPGQANGGNRRYLRPVEAMPENRSYPAGRPSFGYVRRQGEPGFVEKQQRSPDLLAFF